MQNIEKEFEHALEYDGTINSRIPWYNDLIISTGFHVPADFENPCILDLGCGTGNAVKLILQKYKNAVVHFVDLSDNMLHVCKNRYVDPNFVFHKSDIKHLVFGLMTFDIVISQLAIHHLCDKDKYELFISIHNWLKPNGFMSYTDLFKGPDDTIEDLYLEERKIAAFEKGASEEIWLRGIEHYKNYDKHTSLLTQLKWLEEIGYKDIDVTWKKGAFANIVAKKRITNETRQNSL